MSQDASAPDVSSPPVVAAGTKPAFYLVAQGNDAWVRLSEEEVRARGIAETDLEPCFSADQVSNAYARGALETKYNHAKEAILQWSIKHPDDMAVEEFAARMRDKLRRSREEKGRDGWRECDPRDLSCMLREHVEKGDPVDVANFCMMLCLLHAPIT